MKKVGMKLMLEEQLKDKVNLQMAISNTDAATTDTIIDGSSPDEQPGLYKSQSLMSESRFNGEIATPLKIDEEEQILAEEL